MNQENEGLTVGELTMAVGALLLIFLIWSGISKNQSTKNSITPIDVSSEVSKG